MECDKNIVSGAYKLDAKGDVDIVSRGKGVAITAQGGDSQINLMAMGGVHLTCNNALLGIEFVNPGQSDIKLLSGTLGKIVQTAGPPIVGPKIEIAPDSITLSVGPPGVGASIVLGADGITLKHGLTSLKLSGLTGIEESMAATSRKLNPLGHELTAAETTLKVGVAAIETAAPLKKEEVTTVSQTTALFLNVAADAMQQVKAGIEMHG